MAYTDTLVTSLKTEAGTLVATTKTYTADARYGIDDSVPPSTTNMEFDLAVTIANIKSVMLYSDQAVTVKTNSTGSPQETINLAAKKELIWNTDSQATIPFAGNLTKFYVTNTNTAAAAFKVSILADQSP